MGINYNEKNKIFHLFNNNISYYLGVNSFGYLQHFYFGARIDDVDFENITSRGEWSWQYYNRDKDVEEMIPYKYYYEDYSMMEVPVHGGFDKRISQFVFNKTKLNTNYTKLSYVTHCIYRGKKKLETLPSSYGNDADCQTLEITLKDELADLYVTIRYTIFHNLDVITRSVDVINKGDEDINVYRALSMTLDLPDSDYYLTHLYGDWCREKNICRRKLHDGQERIQSNYGFSSHNENPFFILEKENTTETTGEVISLSLMYSGNFMLDVEVNRFNSTRIVLGVNDEDFSYNLKNGEELHLPEAILTYSNKGLGSMSRTLHDFVRNHINRSKYTFKERGILFNSWEGATIDFDTKKICDFIEHSKIISTELFVLDDGWFGKRYDDTSSLGDWFVNKGKIDLKKVIDTCHKNNIKFGIWVEPEMISPHSELYRKHPEYALGVPGVLKSLGRHQFVLDMSNPEVVENIYNQMCALLNEYPIDYVKIDFNRCISEIYSLYQDVRNQGEIYHRFMEGSYLLYEKLLERYPNILFEHCASGGGRFDMGMLAYSPQIQASDVTDAVSRVFINYSSSYAYPLSCIGSHAFSDHLLPYSAKAAIALFGTYGYEMNPLKLDEKDVKEIDTVAKIYKEYHLECIQNGDLYRMSNPYTSNHMSMICVSKNKSKAIGIYFNILKEGNVSRFMKFDGLNDEDQYVNSYDGKTYSGKYYRLIGLNLNKWLGEFETILITFDKK